MPADAWWSPQREQGEGEWGAIYYPTEQEILVSRGGTTPCPGLTDLVITQKKSQAQGWGTAMYYIHGVRNGTHRWAPEGEGQLVAGHVSHPAKTRKNPSLAGWDAPCITSAGWGEGGLEERPPRARE